MKTMVLAHEQTSQQKKRRVQKLTPIDKHAKQICEGKMSKGNEQCGDPLPPGNKIITSWVRDLTNVNETINVQVENTGEF